MKTKRPPKSEDEKLRKWGWRIVSRPECGEAVWVNKYGVTMTHTKAIESLQKFLKESGLG